MTYPISRADFVSEAHTRAAIEYIKMQFGLSLDSDLLRQIYGVFSGHKKYLEKTRKDIKNFFVEALEFALNWFHLEERTREEQELRQAYKSAIGKIANLRKQEYRKQNPPQGGSVAIRRKKPPANNHLMYTTLGKGNQYELILPSHSRTVIP